MLDDYSGLGGCHSRMNIGSMDGNTGRSEGATAEKAVPFPCAVLDPNRSFVEPRVGEPRPGARSVSSPPKVTARADRAGATGADARLTPPHPRGTAIRSKNDLDVKEIVNLWAGRSAAVQ